MKKLHLLFWAFSLTSYAQTTDYEITSYLVEGFKAPNTNYQGEAWLNSVIRADSSVPYNITKATFKANSTLNWHKHTDRQILIVVDGVGYYQEKGKNPIKMKLGDVVKCAADTEHWHSSSKDMDVTYLAIYRGETQWTEVLSQEAYDQVAELLKDN